MMGTIESIVTPPDDGQRSDADLAWTWVCDWLNRWEGAGIGRVDLPPDLWPARRRLIARDEDQWYRLITRTDTKGLAGNFARRARLAAALDVLDKESESSAMENLQFDLWFMAGGSLLVMQQPSSATRWESAATQGKDTSPGTKWGLKLSPNWDAKLEIPGYMRLSGGCYRHRFLSSPHERGRQHDNYDKAHPTSLCPMKLNGYQHQLPNAGCTNS